MSIAVPLTTQAKTKTVVAQPTLNAAPKPKTTIAVSPAIGIPVTTNPSVGSATSKAIFTTPAATTALVAPKPKTTTTAPTVGTTVNAHSTYR